MDDHPQRIARLTPLVEVLARIDTLVQATVPHQIELRFAAGRVLASQATVAPRPPRPIALRDGWAVDSSLTAGAGPHAPAPDVGAVRIDAGQVLPAGADAVASFDLVASGRGGPEIIAPIAPGDGVLPAGADTAGGTGGGSPAALLRAGTRLDPIAIAVLAAAGVPQVAVRVPRLRIRRARARADPFIVAAVDLIASAIVAEGSIALVDPGPGVISEAFGAHETDATIVIGGTGQGRDDASVASLAQAGRVEVHGIALSPGETAAFGTIGAIPVLLVPGRLDAALAVWLTLGRRLLARLAGRTSEPQPAVARLGRKIASRLGLAELIPVRWRDGIAEPLASDYLPLRALAQADGWLLVPAESEGYPAGAEVMVRFWP